MNCPNCGAENPERAKFCMSCGSALAPRCPSCGAENPPGARFCIECGTDLETGAQLPAAEPPAAAAPPEERRKATVLFADLSGYTAVAERMDPEDVKSLVDRALRRLGEEVLRHGGNVDKYIGDNVMAVFGAPVAHEDDPERAVRAGLAMIAAMDEINELIAGPAGVSFALRVGINSGEVLAGEVGDRYTVIGDPVNVAARLQAASRPGSVTVGEGTFRLTRSAITYDEVGTLDLKGKSEPVPAWEAASVLDPEAARRVTRTETPLVGREDESAILESLFERVVRESRPHLVTVIGQAGVGKSRLLRELTAVISGRPLCPAVREGHCPAYGAGVAYWALAEVLRSQFEIVDTDGPDVAWEKLRRGIEELVSDAETDEPPERLAAILARPLGIEPGEHVTSTSSFEVEDPQQMRDRLLSAARSVIEAVSRDRPLLLAFEDIHWADEGMLDLIEYVARWVRGPVLIVCLARDELLDRRSGWGGGRRNATTISLEPLGDEETRELVGALLPRAGDGGNGLTDIAPQVAERSGGNPLFAEEMINRIREEGAAAADTLPDSVHSVLAARLDSLEPIERHLLQHASVVGQTFWQGALAGPANEEGADLADALGALQEKELIVTSAGSRLAGEHEYAFKHALIRDVAYSTLPKSVRVRKHAEVGGFIEDRAGERLDAVVALVAGHYARAATLAAETDLPTDDREQIESAALRSLEAAGERAASLYSNQEALGHFSAAYDLARDGEPAARARIGEKLGDVSLRLGRVDSAVEVWEECLEYHRGEEDLARVGDLHRKIGAGLWHKGQRETSIDHYQRGIDLLKDGPPSLELVRLYEEAASLYMHTGDNMLAIYASEKALRLAERLGEAAAASRAHGIFGRVFGRIGDTEKARENLERSVELARGTDPGEAVRALFTLGYHLEISEADYDEAASAYAEALGLAEQVGALPSQVELHAALAQLAAYRADWEEVERSTEASAALAEREGLLGNLCFPYVMRGVLRWREGRWDDAAAACRRAHELAEQVGRSEVAFAALYWLGATLRDRGDHAEAETTFARALDVCERAGLIAQSIESISARAVTLALGGRPDAAREAAEEAERLSQRIHYPVGEAHTAEARGATDQDPASGAKALAEAREAWSRLGLPVAAARCALLRGGRLQDTDPEAAAEALDAAATEFEQLGVAHFAARARDAQRG
ncbi:MAG TPA: adenylate/guanylate cyclase domain-containing protein [Solirubrobacterales bacterium]|jgi:class 3 adenylate cyclase/tetratricopeptide (TPR) repeat protein|nr:adenylate/guanylate cyclase domain-containing protein [Solirubrobacterales bacterium]